MPGPWRAGSFSAASNRFSSDNSTLSPAGQSASEVVGADGGVAWARFSSFETNVQPRPSPNWAERLANRPKYPTSTRWFAVSTLIFRSLTARESQNVTSVPMTVSASRLAMNTFEQTTFAVAAVADSSPSGGLKVSQPLNPKIPRSTITTRNLNIFRTRRMLPRLVSTSNMNADRTHEPLAYRVWTDSAIIPNQGKTGCCSATPDVRVGPKRARPLTSS